MRSLHHVQSRNIKANGSKAMSSQQASFELKHRVFVAMNKLADRDTYQIGVEELDRTIDGLGPEGMIPFLSCIIETDTEQKSVVHGSFVAPHLGKMITSIVRRLRDQDSVVRDACAETVGILASHLGGFRLGDGGAIVVLSKPLFEALGEQNRYVQTGAAMCLTRVFDEASEAPISFLPQMLTRIVKLLKNPHFMAKPALIDLIRSIIQAGGASAVQTLSLAVNSIQEALKSSDWTTRKAAAVALLGIAESAELLSGSLRPLKASSIHSLECCRFDKVKPVRDAAVQALSSWKSIPGLDSLEALEADSLTKENVSRVDYSESTSPSVGGWKDAFLRKVGRSASRDNCTSMTKRSPLSIRKGSQNNAQDHLYSRADDWHVEISLPKTRITPPVETLHEESEGSCVTKSFEGKNDNAIPRQGKNYGYDQLDDNPECSATSDLVNMSFETKHATVAPDFIEEGNSVNLSRPKHRFRADMDLATDGYLDKTKEYKSIIPGVFCGCPSSSPGELALIRKQLLDIERKQSSLMDLMQVRFWFTTNSMDALSVLQSKVHNLEITVDKIAQDFSMSRNCVSGARSKFLQDSVGSSPGPLAAAPGVRWIRATCSLPRCLQGVGRYDARGDLEAAYAEAIGSGDDLVLIELMDRTGAVLEAFSQETASGVLCALSVYMTADQRYLELAIPWLHQVAELSTGSDPGGLHLTRKARKELLMALQDAAAMDSEERASIEQISSRLRRIWIARISRGRKEPVKSCPSAFRKVSLLLWFFSAFGAS
ncbi:unnamed protein product [Spirodela intermedia]|uniref:Uncharacterized protein n=1 Tax=Spirodela intermedia TaxID=51605 RepID=A0A7I8JPP9_SPIIN|nr:unnamed protein product [Spirodela intermedia]CAA6672100.1 unnamed protein product [Spirodela intermedia]